MKVNDNAFISQKLHNLLSASGNFIITYVSKIHRKLMILYCINSKEWMKKSKWGKEEKYLIISIIFCDIHLYENPVILSDFKAICKCLVKWTYLLIQSSCLSL